MARAKQKKRARVLVGRIPQKPLSWEAGMWPGQRYAAIRNAEEGKMKPPHAGLPEIKDAIDTAASSTRSSSAVAVEENRGAGKRGLRLRSTRRIFTTRLR